MALQTLTLVSKFNNTSHGECNSQAVKQMDINQQCEVFQINCMAKNVITNLEFLVSLVVLR